MPKVKMVRIGNSRAIPIPQAILTQYRIGEEVEIEVRGDCLIIKPVHEAGNGWDDEFSQMQENQDDILFISGDVSSDWDEEAWIW